MTLVMLDYKNTDLEALTKHRVFRWRTVAVGHEYFRWIDENNFVADSILLRGDVSFLVTCSVETPKEVLADFFPVLIKEVGADFIQAHNWDIIASSRQTGELSGRLLWMFDETSIHLMETAEVIGPPIDRPHQASFNQKFYNGIEISNRTQTSSLKLIVSQNADFLMSIQLVGC